MEKFTWEIEGMNQDIAVSKMPNKYAYENVNLRLSSIDNNTLLSLVNEKGNKQIESINGLSEGIKGTVIGNAKFSDCIILFTTDNNSNDRIYKLFENDNLYEGEELFVGDLNFNTSNPIETLVYEESDENKTVYWVDGKNCLRHANIASDAETIKNWSSKSFNHTVELDNTSLGLEVEIDYTINGSFKSGAIQFVATYVFDDRESPIIWDSGLYYISQENRGNEVNDTVSCGFKFLASFLDPSAKYLNIYGLFRGSKLGAWEVFKAKKVKIRTGQDFLKQAKLPTARETKVTPFEYGEPFEIGSSLDNILFHRVGTPEDEYVDAQELFNDQITTVASRGLTTKVSTVYNASKNSIDAFTGMSWKESPLKEHLEKAIAFDGTSSMFGLPNIKDEMFALYRKEKVDRETIFSKGYPKFPRTISQLNAVATISNLVPTVLTPCNGPIVTKADNIFLLIGKWDSSDIPTSNKVYSKPPTTDDAPEEDYYTNVYGPGGYTCSPFLSYNWDKNAIDKILIKVDNDEAYSEYAIDLTTYDGVRNPYPNNTGDLKDKEDAYEAEVVKLKPLLALTKKDSNSYNLWYLGHGCFNEVARRGIQVPIDGGAALISPSYTPDSFRPIGLSIVNKTEEPKYKFTVDSDSGEIVDLGSITLKSANPLIASTIEQKDNTLFLGNVKIENYSISEEDKNLFRELEINFVSDKTTKLADSTLKRYPYKNQLGLGDRKIKTFKYLEWYRFGVQLQYSSGALSEPIWIGDFRNETPIANKDYTDDEYSLVRAVIKKSEVWSELIERLKSKGVFALRPLVIYTDQFTDSECICQGVVCPTVTQEKDKKTTAGADACSSWFFRPNAPYAINDNDYTKYGAKYLFDTNTSSRWNANSIPGVLDLHSDYVKSTLKEATLHYRAKGFCEQDWTDLEEKGYALNDYSPSTFVGSIVEFRHGEPLPNNTKTNCEIQVIEPGFKDEYNFKVNSNIVTLHSPDLEFNLDSFKKLNLSNVGFRIVGLVPLTSNTGDLDLNTNDLTCYVGDETHNNLGFNRVFGNNQKHSVYRTGVINGIRPDRIGDSSWGRGNWFGFKELISCPAWVDAGTTRIKIADEEEIEKLDTDYSDVKVGWIVYPWQVSGSLEGKESYGKLNYKVLSNLRFSIKSRYLSKQTVWDLRTLPKRTDGATYSKMSSVRIYDKDEDVDTVLNLNAGTDGPILKYKGALDTVVFNPDNKEFHRTFFYFPNDGTSTSYTATRNNDGGIGYARVNSTEVTADSCRVQYKSGTHAVFSLDVVEYGGTYLPGIVVNGTSINNKWGGGAASDPVNISYINVPEGGYRPDHLYKAQIGSPHLGFLWLGELYRPNVTNRFGGEPGSQSNWLTCGNFVNIDNYSDLSWDEGDTYYQRYDHTKTYPYDNENLQLNNVREMISFLCETRINLDGRYDEPRLNPYLTSINDEKFNKININYSQINDAFIFKSFDDDNKLSQSGRFNTSIYWSLTKSIGEYLDSWLNFPASSFISLDGDKGSITELCKVNNNLIAFQNHGMSQVLFNEQTLIPTESGIPLEIANSGKVTGKRYISDIIGCSNKYSICKGELGIYFVDDYNKHAYLFNGELNNLSEKFGMDTFFNKHSSNKVWNPINFENCTVYKDIKNNDILYIYKDTCLAFSEKLRTFTSFYNYEKTSYLINDNNHVLSIKSINGRDTLWKQNEGEYNYFFNNYKPFSITLIANDKYAIDKTFTNIEFRADSWNNDSLVKYFETNQYPLDRLEVYDEYQHGISSLTNTKDKPSTLKRKFNIWRANIPRDISNNRNRIRNTWAYIKLSKEEANTNKTVLHDVVVDYIA